MVWIKQGIRFFFHNFGGHVLFGGHWYTCFGLLLTFALDIKERMDPSLACFVSMILKFTSGMILANILMANIATEPFWCTYFFKHWWGNPMPLRVSDRHSKWSDPVWFGMNSNFSRLGKQEIWEIQEKYYPHKNEYNTSRYASNFKFPIIIH